MRYCSLRELRRLVSFRKPSALVIITSRMMRHHSPWLFRELKTYPGKQTTVYLPDGEKAKTWSNTAQLLHMFSRKAVDRNSLVIAAGGGSVGDTAGFAASVYLRGIPYVQIPTTLLAQVDSAIGGKNAINLLSHKNQIGTTYFPTATCIDTRFIKTLPRTERISGLAEIIKMGFIYDPSLVKTIERYGMAIFDKHVVLRRIIFDAIRAKEYFVKRDPYDQGIRNTLNFGHTIGHVIELRHHLSHGEAVLIGMLKELRVGELLGKTDPSIRLKLQSLIQKLGIVVKENIGINSRDILHDKKVRGTKITIPVVATIGKSKLITLDTMRYFSLLQKS